ncbi:hypothetical protein CNEO2_140033 [Clostridium neonatale]|nr:hypothetical protein CNEO2_140033 [Clostridium neonatale]
MKKCVSKTLKYYSNINKIESRLLFNPDSILFKNLFNYFIELTAEVNGGITCFFLDKTPGKNAIESSSLTLNVAST